MMKIGIKSWLLKMSYSQKSIDYIVDFCHSIGMEGYSNCANGSISKDGEPSDFEVLAKYNVDLGWAEIGKLDDGLWIAQTCFQFCADDYAVIKMYFNHFPSEQDVNDAFVLYELEKKSYETFECQNCGRKVNWLELEGDIHQKIKMACDKYCGCEVKRRNDAIDLSNDMDEVFNFKE